MFTGIVTDVGEVLDVEHRAEGLSRLTIGCAFDPETIAIGASIACSGPCLTVVDRGLKGNQAWFAVDAAAGLMAESVEQQKLIGSPNQLEAVMSNLQKRAANYKD